MGVNIIMYLYQLVAQITPKLCLPGYICMTKVAETELIGTCQVLMEHIWNVHKWAKNPFNAHTTAINVMVY